MGMTREQAEAWAERFNERVPPGKDLVYEVNEVKGSWRVRARHPQREARPRFRERHPTLTENLASGFVFVLFWGAIIGGCGYLIATSDSGDDSSPAGARCHPDYSGCLDPDASDYDCAGGTGDGPKYTGSVEIKGDDPFDLDRDGNGAGCE